MVVAMLMVRVGDDGSVNLRHAPVAMNSVVFALINIQRQSKARPACVKY